MQFKDYYATLGVERDASADEIKRAYRRLARKYHPDVSTEPDAEARIKALNEAHEVLGDPGKRSTYDDLARRQKAGHDFEPPPGWSHTGGYGDGGGPRDFSDFFSTIFGRASGGGTAPAAGRDRHAKVEISLQDAYRGAQRTVLLQVPSRGRGQTAGEQRQIDVNIPKGVREGQKLRLAGLGQPPRGNVPAGDLLLEIAFAPHPHFRVEGRDVYLALPIAPWEAALGAMITVPMPDGSVQLSVPPASATGRKLRLKGKGLPGSPPGDLYAVLEVTAPPATTTDARDAYAALARSFPDFDPRRDLSH